jgi:hypothetical protein
MSAEYPPPAAVGPAAGSAEAIPLGEVSAHRERLLEIRVALDTFGDDQCAGPFVMG